MKVLILTTVLRAVKLARAAPFTDLASFGTLPQNAFDMADLPSSVLASSIKEWKVGDACVGGGSPGTCVLEDLGGFFKPACANDISFFGCGSNKDVATWGQAQNSMRCCVQKRCAPPWDNWFCKNTYKTIMPSGFHPDPDLCGIGSDVLCWIEPSAEGDPPPGDMTTPSIQAGALDAGDPGNVLMVAGFGGGNPSNDPGWLASDTSGLLENKVNDFGSRDSLGGISGSEDFPSELGDGSVDYSMLSR